MGKNLKLLSIEQALSTLSIESHELNKIIGLYNSRHHNDEINIQVIDNSVYITEGEKDALKQFIQTELVSISDFERESGIAAGNIETMLRECATRGDIPSNAYISALTVGGQYYIHRGYLNHFDERFGAFSDFIENTPEELLEEELSRNWEQTSQNTDDKSSEVSSEEPEEEEEFIEEDDDNSVDKKKKSQKLAEKRKAEQKRLEYERQQSDNRIATMQKEIEEARTRALLEEQYKNATIRKKELDNIAFITTQEILRKQEEIRKDFERKTEATRKQEYAKQQDLKAELERKQAYDKAREEALRQAQHTVENFPSYTSSSYNQSNVKDDYSLYSEASKKSDEAKAKQDSYPQPTFSKTPVDNSEAQRKADEAKAEAQKKADEAKAEAQRKADQAKAEAQRKTSERLKSEQKKADERLKADQAKADEEKKAAERKQHQDKVASAMGSQYIDGPTISHEGPKASTFSFTKSGHEELKKSIEETQQQRLNIPSSAYNKSPYDSSNVEVAKVETISGNPYVVPESRAQEFKVIKEIYESPGTTPPAIKNQLRDFEAYNPTQYQSVAHIPSSETETPKYSPSSSDTSPKPSSSSPDTSTKPSSTSPDTFPKHSTPSSDISPSSSVDTSNKTNKHSKSSENTYASINLITVDGKAVAEISEKYVASVKHTINTSDGTIKNEGLRVIIASGVIDDDKLKTRVGTFTTAEGLNSVKVAKDICNTTPTDNTKPVSRNEMANRIVISGITEVVKKSDYDNGQLSSKVHTVMNDTYKEVSETEGQRLKAKSVTSAGPKYSNIIGNYAETHQSQTTKNSSSRHPPPESYQSKGNRKGIDPQKIIVAKGNVNNTASQEKSPDPVDTEQMQKLKSAHVPINIEKMISGATNQISHNLAHAVGQSQTGKGVYTVVQGAKVALEVGNVLTGGKLAQLHAQTRAADYIKNGAKGRGIFKGQTKSANYINTIAQVKNRQHNFSQVNEVLRKNKFKLSEKDEDIAQIDATLGLSLKKTRVTIGGKSDKATEALSKYLKLKNIDLNNISEMECALLLNEMKRDKKAFTLWQKIRGDQKGAPLSAKDIKLGRKALKNHGNAKELGDFANLKKVKTGKGRYILTNKAMQDAETAITKFLKHRGYQGLENMSAWDLRQLAKRCKDGDEATMLLGLAALKDNQQELTRFSILKSTQTIKRLLRGNLQKNDAFNTYYKMSDILKKTKKVFSSIAGLNAKIVKHLNRRLHIKDKKINRIQKRIKKKGPSARRTRRLEKLEGKRDKLTKKISKRNEKLKTGGPVKKIKNKAKDKIKSGRDKLYQKTVGKATSRLRQTRAGKWASKKLAPVRALLNKAKEKLSTSIFAKILAQLLKIFRAIADALKAVLHYILIGLAILIAIILLSNLSMYLVGHLGNTIAELLGQQAFTDEAAGKALVALQVYDEKFFAATDAIQRQMKTQSLEDVVADHQGWFKSTFTNDDVIYGFIALDESKEYGFFDSELPVRYTIEYGGTPYLTPENKDSTSSQFEQRYYRGWVMEDDYANKESNLISRYANAKDILCTANAVYGGEINKYWEAIKGFFGGKTSKDYCKRLWVNSHFCGVCREAIEENNSSANAICVHTRPLSACTDGKCDGKTENTYTYYCNYNNPKQTNTEKKTNWIYFYGSRSPGWEYDLWDGEEVVHACNLGFTYEDEALDRTFDVEDDTQRRLCVVNFSKYAITGSETDNNTVKYEPIELPFIGQQIPYTLYGEGLTKVNGIKNIGTIHPFVWPTASNTITSYYGGESDPTANEDEEPVGAIRFHKGLDITYDSNNLDIFAIADGKVTYVTPVNERCSSDGDVKSGRCTGCKKVVGKDANGKELIETVYHNNPLGNNIKIEHTITDAAGKEWKFTSIYMHLASINDAAFNNKDKTVLRGAKIGVMGNTGQSSGTHLHFQTEYGGKSFDPMILYGGYTFGRDINANGAGCVSQYCKEEPQNTNKVTAKQPSSTNKDFSIPYTVYPTKRVQDFNTDKPDAECDNYCSTTKNNTKIQEITYCSAEQVKNKKCTNPKDNTKHVNSSMSYNNGNYCSNISGTWKCRGYSKPSTTRKTYTYKLSDRAFVSQEGCDAKLNNLKNSGKNYLFAIAYVDSNHNNTIEKDEKIYLVVENQTEKDRVSGQTFTLNQKMVNGSLETTYTFEYKKTTYSSSNCGSGTFTEKNGQRTITGPDCDERVFNNSVTCNGHTMCNGHTYCNSHRTCVGHTLVYCTGHTSFYTETVIVGLNDSATIKTNGTEPKDQSFNFYDPDVMHKVTTNRYDIQHGVGDFDETCGAKFSLGELNIAKKARAAYAEDWAEKYSIEFYQENTPFSITETEVRAILVRQNNRPESEDEEATELPLGDNNGLAELALLSVGRVNYHDTFSEKYDWKEIDKIQRGGDATTPISEQFREIFSGDVSGFVGADSAGRVMKGLNAKTYPGYIFWSAGLTDTFIKNSDTLLSQSFIQKINTNDAIPFSQLKPGDLCSFPYKKVNAFVEGDKDYASDKNIKEVVGIIVAVNRAQGETNKTGDGTIGVVLCSNGHSDAVYLIIGKEAAEFYNSNGAPINFYRVNK